MSATNDQRKMSQSNSVSIYARICNLYNLQPSKNEIGTSGEAFVNFALSYFPFFNIYFLDGKAPIEDFFCEVNDANFPFPFLIQVKSTTSGTTGSGSLSVTLPEDKKDALIKRPVPTYLAGVNIDKMEVYIAPVFDPTVKYGVIPPKHVIRLKNRVKMAKEIDLLKQDVINYWLNCGINTFKSTYTSKL